MLGVVLAVSGWPILDELAHRAPSPLAREARLAVVRQIVADAAGQPFSFRLVTNREDAVGWPAPWIYTFRYAGAEPTEERVDLPAYVIFDPSDFAGGASYGGVVVDNVRWVRFEPAGIP